MRTTSKVSQSLTAFLFLSPATANQFGGPERTLALIHESSAAIGEDAVKHAMDNVAYAYGDHPETAAPRMAACLTAVEALRGHLQCSRTAVNL